MTLKRNSNHRFYRNAAVGSAVYSIFSVYLLFAIANAVLQKDMRYFDLDIIAWVILGTVIYGFFCYRKLRQLDGVNSRGLGWKLSEAQVKLPARKAHRRFG
ncbi:Uncharacterised protein [Halioglobus japonicus]|nr:Uncharacterised protein [Halioglobus japonicus]